jgi:hypothetical protein
VCVCVCVCVCLTLPPSHSPASFIALIEKDWLYLGHAFSTRHGHFGARSPRERAPVFLLFLDAVWQVCKHTHMCVCVCVCLCVCVCVGLQASISAAFVAIS